LQRDDILKTPKEEESKKGADLCLNNASSLIADAEVLLKQESYGHAVFLAISAIEETTKAYVCAINRIEGKRTLFDELKDYTYGREAHTTKIILFLSFRLMEAIGKAMEKEHKEITKPLDINDFVEVGRDLDSGSKAILTGKLQGLYVDFREGKWTSPFDLTRKDAESSIEYANKYKEQVNFICRRILDAPLDLVEAAKEFIDKLLLAYINGFYQNAEMLYKNGKITKELYDRILSKKKEHDSLHGENKNKVS